MRGRNQRSEAGDDILDSILELQGATVAQLLEETGRDVEEVERELAALQSSRVVALVEGLWVARSRRRQRRAQAVKAASTAPTTRPKGAKRNARADTPDGRWSYGDASRRVVSALVLLGAQRPVKSAELAAVLVDLGEGRRIRSCLQHCKERGYVAKVGARHWRVTPAGERWLIGVDRKPLNDTLDALGGRATARQIQRASGRSINGVYSWLRSQIERGLIEVVGREARHGIGGAIYAVVRAVVRGAR